MAILTFPVSDYRIQNIPGHRGKMLHAFVPISSLSEELDVWMEVNPRIPVVSDGGRVTSGCGLDIYDTLKNDPDQFAIVNRGMTILAREVKGVDHAGGQKVVEINLTNDKAHGLTDGGHTYKVCLYALRQLNGHLKDAYVALKVITGVPEDEITEVAEKLNTSLQVDERSVSNLNKKYEPVKEAMKGEYGERAIAYHQGDKGEYNVINILGLLELMNRHRFPGLNNGKGQHPKSIYRQPGKLHQIYGLDLETTGFQQLIKQLPTITWLYAKLKEDFRDVYNGLGKSFGKTKHAKRKSCPLLFIPGSTTYEIWDGWVAPMVSAFRANVEMTEKTFKWKCPIKDVYEQVRDSLVSSVANSEKKPSELGRDQDMFHMLFQSVEVVVQRLK